MQPGRTWSSRFTSDRPLWTAPQRDATSHLDIKLRHLDNVTTGMTPSTPERQPHGKRMINQNRPPRKRNPVVPGHHDSLRIDRFGPHRNATQLRTWTSNCDAWTMSPQTCHSRHPPIDLNRLYHTVIPGHHPHPYHFHSPFPPLPCDCHIRNQRETWNESTGLSLDGINFSSLTFVRTFKF